MNAPFYSDGFNAYIYCSDSYIESDSNSEIALSAIPSPAQTVNGTNWLKVLVKGINCPVEAISAIAQKQTYELILLGLNFPNEVSLVKNIKSYLRKKYKYLCVKPEVPSSLDYPDVFHENNNCIALNHEYKIETSDNYDDGMNEIKLIFTKRYFVIS